MSTRANKRGFTLVELIMGTLISSILLMTVTLILVMPAQSNKQNKEYANIRREVTYAMRVLARDIRCAPYSNIVENYGVHKLILPERDGEFNDVWIDTVSYQFDTTLGRLIRYVNGSQQDVLISRGLTQFSSSLPGDGSRGVVLRYAMGSADGKIALSHETFIHARN